MVRAHRRQAGGAPRRNQRSTGVTRAGFREEWGCSASQRLVRVRMGNRKALQGKGPRRSRTWPEQREKPQSSQPGLWDPCKCPSVNMGQEHH